MPRLSTDTMDRSYLLSKGPGVPSAEEAAFGHGGAAPKSLGAPSPAGRRPENTSIVNVLAQHGCDNLREVVAGSI